MEDLAQFRANMDELGTRVYNAPNKQNGTWTYIGLDKHVHRLLIDPVEPRSLYPGTDEGLFWSFNRGDLWQRLEAVPAEPVPGLAMEAQGRVLYAAVNTVGVFKGV